MQPNVAAPHAVISRPLLSSRIQTRTTGSIACVCGLASLIASLWVEGVGGAIFGAVICAPGMFASQYFVSRRLWRNVTAVSEPAPTVERQRPAETVMRSIVWAVVVEAFIVAITLAYRHWNLADNPIAFMGGLQLGLGVNFVAVSVWIERWEREHGRRLLQEARRFGPAGKSAYFADAGPSPRT